ncbi:MAG: SMR family transporter [Candidatus Eisenbacteria bacterium]|nr:SMR family transporter [Candidatus Eisenbacteria bacterium]
MSRYLPQILLAAALVLNAGANVLMKYSAARAHLAPESAGLLERLAARFHPAFLVGLALFAANVFAYQASLRTLKLSLAYPIMVSGGYLLILFASWFLFQERLGLIQYFGIGLILAGIWMVVR